MSDILFSLLGQHFIEMKKVCVCVCIYIYIYGDSMILLFGHGHINQYL